MDKLGRIRLLHTGIWALLAGAILALLWASWTGRFQSALWLSAIILGECIALALNRGRCPLTNIAARYTEDRSDNFDIYLPAWLARYNKLILGSLFVLGELILLWQWARHIRQ